MAIKSFAYYNLKKDFYAEYMVGFVEKLEKSASVKAVFAEQALKLRASTKKMSSAFNRPNKSAISRSMMMLDRQRDGLITGLRHIINSFLKSSDNQQVAAAERLMFGLENMGLNISAPMIAQTAQIEKLVNYFLVLNADAVRTLGLGTLLEQLNALNESFAAKTSLRTEEFGKLKFDSLRTSNEKDYRNFVEHFNAWWLLNKAEIPTRYPDMQEFVENVNNVITYYKSYILRAPSIDKPTGEAPAGSLLPASDAASAEEPIADNPIPGEPIATSDYE